ncbi:hypothetical protein Tco_0878404 [Tanacetum coccineum]|uniref:Uncharacterized protein n=1 Tax=Tanacetum coccineum TaxID=301880 RepID=A0ABQ5C170_9ASTR
MTSSSSSSTYLIKFHRGGVFLVNVQVISNSLLSCSWFRVKVRFENLKNDEDLAQCVKLGGKNGNVLDIYVSHTVIELHDATSNSQQDVGNVEKNDDSESNLDDDYNIFEVDSESEESDTASVDHLSDGEEEGNDARTRKLDPAPKKMYNANF